MPADRGLDGIVWVYAEGPLAIGDIDERGVLLAADTGDVGLHLCLHCVDHFGQASAYPV